MSEQNKETQSKSVQPQQDAPESPRGASSDTSFSWKRLLAKKWVFPAAYMAAAAIILTMMWVYQDSGEYSLSQEEQVSTVEQQPAPVVQRPDAVAVTAPAETMQWPVSDREAVEVVMPFYDSQASGEVRQAALLQYGDTFIPHVGLGLARDDNESFEVMAALSGTVVLVEQHPLVGHQVAISHSNGLTTIYQSLSEVQVRQGDEVTQGDVIAKAGRNELEKDLGVHVHFEVRQGLDGQALDPALYLTDSRS